MLLVGMTLKHLTVMNSVMFRGVEDPFQRSKVSDQLKEKYYENQNIFFLLYSKSVKSSKNNQFTPDI